VADRLIAITQSLYDAFNRGNLEAQREHMHPELEITDPDRTGQVHRGFEGYQEFIGDWLESWDEYRVEIKGLTRNGDSVLIDLVQSGVGKESGIEFSEPFSQVLTFRDEKVVRFAIFIDRVDAERAAGLRD
jgi:ketosteroid isomerase-like protein